MGKPYIGITGFTDPEEVAAVLAAFPNNPSRQLMVGVLTTYKSLRGIPIKPRWAKQTPPPECLPNLFLDDERVINLVHFSTEDGKEKSVLADLLKIHELAGPNIHGFQLNLTWPNIQLLSEYRKKVGDNYRLVLQLGRWAVEAIGGTPRGVVFMLQHYVGIIDDILFDASGGLGIPLEQHASHFLSVIAEQGWNLGLGVAGGLGPDSLNLVEPLLAQFPYISIDAQGQLRDDEIRLDLNKAQEYLSRSLKMLNI